MSRSNIQQRYYKHLKSFLFEYPFIQNYQYLRKMLYYKSIGNLNLVSDMNGVGDSIVSCH